MYHLHLNLSFLKICSIFILKYLKDKNNKMCSILILNYPKDKNNIPKNNNYDHKNMPYIWMVPSKNPEPRKNCKIFILLFQNFGDRFRFEKRCVCICFTITDKK